MPDRFLFIPGYAKAGTTFLFDQLVGVSERFNVPIRKELGAFSVPITKSDYCRLFETSDPSRVYVDATPFYVDPRNAAFANISSALGRDDVFVIICIRDPFRRAYSHYLYDLRMNFWTYAFDNYQFEDVRVRSRYLQPLGPKIKEAKSLFGADRVHGWCATGNSHVCLNALKQFAGLSETWKPDSEGERHSGGWLPRVHYDAFKPVLVLDGAHLLEVPPRALLVSNGPNSMLEFNYPVDLGERLVRASASWTRSFDFSSLGLNADLLIEDFVDALQQFGITQTGVTAATSVTAAPPPPLPGGIRSQLTVLHDAAQKTEQDVSTAAWRPSIGSAVDQIDSEYRTMVAVGPDGFVAQQRYHKLLLDTLNEFGPIPTYIDEFIALSLATGQPELALNYLYRFPSAARSVGNREWLATKFKFYRGGCDALVWKRLVDAVGDLNLDES